MLDRRKTIRRRTLLAGRVEVEKLNGWAVECVIRNISDAGARIALPADVIVPCAFELGVSGDVPKAARLVWYKDGQAGIALLDRHANDLPDPDAARPRPAVVEPNLLQARIAAIAAPARRHATRSNSEGRWR